MICTPLHNYDIKQYHNLVLNLLDTIIFLIRLQNPSLFVNLLPYTKNYKSTNYICCNFPKFKILTYTHMIAKDAHALLSILLTHIYY
ncbi:MAG: hypothetical protein H6Q70_4355 [Firmicutes bacterium]|nr:hypothetical protein [Bacillota bacterium]